MNEILDYGKKLEEQDILKLEEKIKFSLPLEYKLFLLKYNGGYPKKDFFTFFNKISKKIDGSGIDRFHGIDVNKYDNFNYYLDVYKNRIPQGFLPIAHDAGGGLIILGLYGEYNNNIYFWDRDYEVEDGEVPYMENIYMIWEGFENFINGLNYNYEDLELISCRPIYSANETPLK